MRTALTELRRTYRLINHGPTTLVSARAGDETNVMAAAWVMAVDFDPPKIAAVVAAGTYTRELIDKSGEFVVNIPTVTMADMVWTVGHTSGHELAKLKELGITTSAAQHVGAPLIDGCVAWLECRVIPQPLLAQDHDIFLAEVVAAWFDDEVFVKGAWDFDQAPHKRTLHHLANGVFYATGEKIAGKLLTPAAKA